MNICVEFGDMLKREGDGLIFRCLNRLIEGVMFHMKDRGRLDKNK